MKNTFFALVCFALVAICSSCTVIKNDKKNSNPNDRVEQQGAISLSGKTTSEVLKLKYTKAELKCALWTQKSQSLDLNLTPSDMVVINLKTTSLASATITLNGRVDEQINDVVLSHTFLMTLNVLKFSIIDNLRFVDGDGTVYTEKFTPAIEVSTSFVSETIYGQNPTEKGSGSNSKMTFYERVLNPVFIASQAIPSLTFGGVVINPGFYFDHVQCLIDTEIKPEYQDQLQIVLGK